MAEIDDNAHLKSGTGTHIFRLKGLQTKVFLNQNPNYAPYDTPPVNASYFMDISINSLLLDNLIFISAASNYIDNSRWPDISFSLGRINNSSKTDIDTYFVNHITKDIGPAWLAKNITGGYNNSDIFHNEDELVQQYITMDKTTSNLNYLQISPTDLSKKLAINKISIHDITSNSPVILYSPDASGSDLVTPGWITGSDPSYALTTSDSEYLLYNTLDQSGVFIKYGFNTQIGHAYKINTTFVDFSSLYSDINFPVSSSVTNTNDETDIYIPSVVTHIKLKAYYSNGDTRASKIQITSNGVTTTVAFQEIKTIISSSYDFDNTAPESDLQENSTEFLNISTGAYDNKHYGYQEAIISVSQYMNETITLTFSPSSSWSPQIGNYPVTGFHEADGQNGGANIAIEFVVNNADFNSDINVSIIDSSNNKPLYLHYDDEYENNTSLYSSNVIQIHDGTNIIDASTNIIFYDNSIKSQIIKLLKRGGTSEANPVSGMNLTEYYISKYNLGREIMLSMFASDNEATINRINNILTYQPPPIIYDVTLDDGTIGDNSGNIVFYLNGVETPVLHLTRGLNYEFNINGLDMSSNKFIFTKEIKEFGNDICLNPIDSNVITSGLTFELGFQLTTDHYEYEAGNNTYLSMFYNNTNNNILLKANHSYNIYVIGGGGGGGGGVGLFGGGGGGGGGMLKFNTITPAYDMIVEIYSGSGGGPHTNGTDSYIIIDGNKFIAHGGETGENQTGSSGPGGTGGTTTIPLPSQIEISSSGGSGGNNNGNAGASAGSSGPDGGPGGGGGGSGDQYGGNGGSGSATFFTGGGGGGAADAKSTGTWEGGTGGDGYYSGGTGGKYSDPTGLNLAENGGGLEGTFGARGDQILNSEKRPSFGGGGGAFGGGGGGAGDATSGTPFNITDGDNIAGSGGSGAIIIRSTTIVNHYHTPISISAQQFYEQYDTITVNNTRKIKWSIPFNEVNVPSNSFYGSDISDNLGGNIVINKNPIYGAMKFIDGDVIQFHLDYSQKAIVDASGVAVDSSGNKLGSNPIEEQDYIVRLHVHELFHQPKLKAMSYDNIETRKVALLLHQSRAVAAGQKLMNILDIAIYINDNKITLDPNRTAYGADNDNLFGYTGGVGNISVLFDDDSSNEMVFFNGQSDNGNIAWLAIEFDIPLIECSIKCDIIPRNVWASHIPLVDAVIIESYTTDVYGGRVGSLDDLNYINRSISDEIPLTNPKTYPGVSNSQSPLPAIKDISFNIPNAVDLSNHYDFSKKYQFSAGTNDTTRNWKNWVTLLDSSGIYLNNEASGNILGLQFATTSDEFGIGICSDICDNILGPAGDPIPITNSVWALEDSGKNTLIYDSETIDLTGYTGGTSGGYKLFDSTYPQQQDYVNFITDISNSTSKSFTIVITDITGTSSDLGIVTLGKRTGDQDGFNDLYISYEHSQGFMIGTNFNGEQAAFDGPQINIDDTPITIILTYDNNQITIWAIKDNNVTSKTHSYTVDIASGFDNTDTHWIAGNRIVGSDFRDGPVIGRYYVYAKSIADYIELYDVNNVLNIAAQPYWNKGRPWEANINPTEYIHPTKFLWAFDASLNGTDYKYKIADTNGVIQDYDDTKLHNQKYNWKIEIKSNNKLSLKTSTDSNLNVESTYSTITLDPNSQYYLWIGSKDPSFNFTNLKYLPETRVFDDEVTLEPVVQTYSQGSTSSYNTYSVVDQTEVTYNLSTADVTYLVTQGSNKIYIDGNRYSEDSPLVLFIGDTYRFNLRNDTNIDTRLVFSTSSDGTGELTNGITYNGTPGVYDTSQESRDRVPYVDINTNDLTDSTIYYYDASGVNADLSGTIVVKTPNEIIVTVVNNGSKNIFNLSPNNTLVAGDIYRFIQSDSTNTNHPFRISLTEDGSEYITGVSYVGIPGQSGSYTQLIVPSDYNSGDLYYKCQFHGGMGAAFT